MKHLEFAKVLCNNEISKNIFEMKIYVPLTANEAKIGQFINIYTGAGEFILPRPISICEIDKDHGTLTIVYQVVGKGTKILSSMTGEREIKIVGPLGNGFEISPDISEHIVVGGGIGVPPLVELVKNINGKVTVFLGFRSTPIIVEKFKELGADVYVATDDGSAGFKGNVVEFMNKIEPKGKMVYACGPKIMLKNVAAWAEKRNIKSQVSMEERMACGIGACVGCVVKIKKGEEWQHMKVCKDGPVFWGDEVVWDE